MLLTVEVHEAGAAFMKFEGGVPADNAWKVAATSFVLEDFKSYAETDSVASLPSLGLTFAPLAHGGLPGIYTHSIDNTPYLPKQLANFPGACCTNQSDDVVANVDAGVNLFGLGFWNGDPQGNSLLRVYDRAGVLIGTVTAATNTGGPGALSDSFAGFISTVPIGRLEWEGSAGDGFNHYDGIEVTFDPVSAPEPSALLLLGAACLSVRLLKGSRNSKA